MLDLQQATYEIEDYVFLAIDAASFFFIFGIAWDDCIVNPEYEVYRTPLSAWELTVFNPSYEKGMFLLVRGLMALYYGTRTYFGYDNSEHF